MNSVKKSNDLLRLFIELKQVMIRENENNWIRGVNLIIEALSPPEYGGKGSADEAVRYVENTYRNMVSGNGSFSDFFIWRDDFDDRVKANKELDRIKADIWTLIDN
jgi:hypothetical protein